MNFSEGCLYIAIKAEVNDRDGLSGKYYLHSLYKNIGAYVREPGEIQGFTQHQFFLAYGCGYWYITSAPKDYEFLWGGANSGGYFRITTQG